MTRTRSVRCVVPAAALAGLALLGWARPAPALTYVKMASFEEIVAGAAVAFRGVVIDVTSGNAKGPRDAFLPYTKVTFAIERPLYGVAPGQSTISIYQLGGPRATDPSRHVLFLGLPSYRIGDRAIVFANDRTHPAIGTMYGDAGMRRVVTAPGGQQLVLTAGWNVLEGTPGTGFRASTQGRCVPAQPRSTCLEIQTGYAEPTVDFDAQGEPIPEPGAPPVTLAAFEEKVLAVLANQGLGMKPAQTITATEQAFVQYVESVLAAQAQGD